MTNKVEAAPPPAPDAPQVVNLPTIVVAKPSFLSDHQRDILSKSALCARLDENQRAYFFEVVERTRLDPFTGQIKADIRNSKDPDDRNKKIPTLVLITTLQGLRVLAERTGKHQGEEGPQWCGTNGEWVDVWLPDAPPAAARAKVFRSDRDRPQSCVVRWDAFVQMEWGTGGQLQPGVFWKKMGSHMLGKCSLAGCYRGAYPDPCSGLYIPEELAPELDPDSEEAIEAEMIDRARREKEHWEKQNAKGVYSIDQQQAQEKAAAETNHQNGETNGASAETTEAPDPDKMIITRIEHFRGRTVGSLSRPEVIGLRTWLDRAHEKWDMLDESLRAHYLAIVDRYNRDQSSAAEAEEQEATDQANLDTLPDGLDISAV
jgi:hypothetical protein